MAAPVEIRRATDADAAGIASCLDRAFDAFRPHYPDDGYRDSVPDEDSVRRRLRSMTLFVATSSGKIVGTVSCDISAPGVGHLRGMAVLPAWQGQGVASALLHAAEDYLRRESCTNVTLDTTAPLERAIRFYEREGYRASGRVGDFFGMPLFEYVKTL
jgi:GNAT superfamily N-acetyltransferase